MKSDQLVDAAKLALILGAGYMGWKVYGRVRDWGEDVGGAIGSTLYDFVHPPATGPDADSFRVIAGDVYHVIQRPGDPIRYRVFDFAQRRWMDPQPGYKLPENWRAAPYAVAGFPEKRAYGQPWYNPWDGKGRGLEAVLQPLTTGDQAVALAQAARATPAGNLLNLLFQASPIGIAYDAAAKAWKYVTR